MKKLGILLLITIIGLSQIACGKTETVIKDVKELEAVESFGNQRNQQWGGTSFVLTGNWLFGPEESEHIVKQRLADNAELEIFFATSHGNCELGNVAVFDGWIYFTAEEALLDEVGDTDIYRISKNGSVQMKLLDGDDYSGNYVIAKEGIVYLKGGSVYIMSLGGANKRQIPIAGKELKSVEEIAIDDGWIYCSDYYNLFRMKPDGTKTEKILQLSSEIGDYVADKNEIYYVRVDYGTNKCYLLKKTIGGKEINLGKGPIGTFNCLNIEGDWIYFTRGNTVYKMKRSGEEIRQMIYVDDQNEQINSLLVYSGNVLINTDTGNVYIRKDGTTINMESPY